jgi:hypothetical protein
VWREPTGLLENAKVKGVVAAAQPLAALLAGKIRGVLVSGHAIKTIDDARPFADQCPREGRETGLALRELAITRGLYRCGDHQDLGRNTLTHYAQDLRGYFAHHARTVLESTKTDPARRSSSEAGQATSAIGRS